MPPRIYPIKRSPIVVAHISDFHIGSYASGMPYVLARRLLAVYEESGYHSPRPDEQFIKPIITVLPMRS